MNTKIALSAIFFLLTMTSSSIRCSMFYTMNSDVRTSEQLPGILQWNFNATQTVSNGVCHSIKCYVEKNGNDVSVGNWSVTSVEINPALNAFYNGRLSMSCDMKTVTLTISNPVYADSGKYSCMYKNKTVDVHLTVSGGPTFVAKNYTSTVSFTEGVSNAVQVTYCGNPAPVVEWQWFGENIRSPAEHIEEFNTSTQRSFCYRYTFQTQNLSRHICPTSLSYTVSGFLSPTTHTSKVTLKYIPEKLKNARIVWEKGCLLTTWDGPSVGPLTCKSQIEYDIRIKLKTQSSQIFTSYSTNFLLCNNTIHLQNIQEINVRYRNMFGDGSFVVADFPVNTSVTPVISSTEEKSYEEAFIAVLSVVALLLLIAFIVCCVLLYRRCCNSEDDVGEPKDEFTVVEETPTTLKRLHKDKYNTLRKQDIIPKPRPMSHVITRPVSKSNTFHGTSIANRFSTDEATLHKAFMPMNTLQRRITESLTAYNNHSASCQTLTNIHAPFVIENNNVDSDINRLSMETESTTCSPAENRRHENLSRMSSLDSIQSEYDNVARVKKARSNYDLPRCTTLPNITPKLTHRAQSMYDLPQRAIIPFPQVNTVNNINSQYSPSHRKVSEESATSDYSTPRNTIFEDEDAVDFYEPQVKSEQVENAYAHPQDISSEIQKEKLKLEKRDSERLNKNLTEHYDKPSDVCQPIKSFDLPCVTRVDGLYDTPKNCRLRREQLMQNRAQSVDQATTDDPTHVAYDELPRRATVPTPQNLYDNIKEILDERGIATDPHTLSGGHYEELPMKKALQSEEDTQYLESSLADISVA